MKTEGRNKGGSRVGEMEISKQRGRKETRAE
jgi:hypothetical protein